MSEAAQVNNSPTTHGIYLTLEAMIDGDTQWLETMVKRLVAARSWLGCKVEVTLTTIVINTGSTTQYFGKRDSAYLIRITPSC